ncbi:DUF6944 family repetitive protein [Guptibacillus hwajinpoensis]|uniref:DUF6944 family repetitive protein n=1 Tax=Guptibacillus hwajinpoensis TaxID=208199 RepID=UPI001CFF3D8C|nr:hypothetical protein [Pseudalkalibacillus hwajinpoensis]
MQVYGDLTVVTGAWIQALGAAVASVGDTIVAIEEKGTVAEDVGGDLYVIGNAIEATGNALQAVGRESLPEDTPEKNLGILGSWLQSAGNIANVLGGAQALSIDEEEGLNIDIIGDVIQTIGAGFEAQGSSLSQSPFAKAITTGQTIQTYALTIETIGLFYIKKKRVRLGEQILAVGSYAQTAGSLLEAIAYTKEFHLKHLGDLSINSE